MPSKLTAIAALTRTCAHDRNQQQSCAQLFLFHVRSVQEFLASPVQCKDFSVRRICTLGTILSGVCSPQHRGLYL